MTVKTLAAQRLKPGELVAYYYRGYRYQHTFVGSHGTTLVFQTTVTTTFERDIIFLKLIKPTISRPDAGAICTFVERRSAAGSVQT